MQEDTGGPPDIDEVRRENEALKARQRDIEAAPASGAERRPLRRIFLEAVAGGSLLTALIGGGFTIVGDLLDDERCPIAHEALRDDTLNEALSAAQRKSYIDQQYAIARKCGRESS